jgi:hypothetical protein
LCLLTLLLLGRTALFLLSAALITLSLILARITLI